VSPRPCESVSEMYRRGRAALRVCTTSLEPPLPVRPVLGAWPAEGAGLACPAWDREARGLPDASQGVSGAGSTAGAAGRVGPAGSLALDRSPNGALLVLGPPTAPLTAPATVPAALAAAAPPPLPPLRWARAPPLGPPEAAALAALATGVVPAPAPEPTAGPRAPAAAAMAWALAWGTALLRLAPTRPPPTFTAVLARHPLRPGGR
jgi:hypothetical protein